MTDDGTLRERFLDELTSPESDEVPSPEAAELRDYRRIWEALGALPEIDVPGNARRRAREAASSELEGHRYGMPLPRVLAAAAAAAVVFLGGYLVGDWSVPAEPTVDDRPRYVLLIRGRVPPDQEGRAAERMAEWAAELRADGHLVAAERLRENDARWVGPASGPEVREPVVGGYFVVRAADPDEAVRLARGSPHLAFGGRVAVEVVPVAR